MKTAGVITSIPPSPWNNTPTFKELKTHSNQLATGIKGKPVVLGEIIVRESEAMYAEMKKPLC